jgi:hypothetical protein
MDRVALHSKVIRRRAIQTVCSSVSQGADRAPNGIAERTSQGPHVMTFNQVIIIDALADCS